MGIIWCLEKVFQHPITDDDNEYATLASTPVCTQQHSYGDGLAIGARAVSCVQQSTPIGGETHDLISADERIVPVVGCRQPARQEAC